MKKVFLKLQDFVTKETLGQFNSRNLFRISDTKSREDYIAMISSIELDYYFQNEIINSIRELSILSQVNHPTIPKLIGYNLKSSNDNPYIITESHSSYTLDSLLFEKNKTSANFSLNNTQKLINIYGIASCMSYLHSNGILHRDLKTGNIFIDNNSYPKVSGFHISKEIPSNSLCQSNFIKGTPAYISPEIYARKEYSKASDVYSFSFVVYEIMTNERAFSNFENINEIVNEVSMKGYRPNISEKVPKSYRDLIEKCWSQDPTKRPSFDEIVHSLKTDSGFITEDTNESEFKSYVKMIETSDISFDKQNRINEYDELMSSKLNDYRKFEFSLNLTQIYETETNNLPLNLKFIDISEFRMIEKMDVQRILDMCELAHIETGTKFLSRIYHSKIDSFSRDEKISLSREVSICSQIKHPAINKFIGVSLFDFKKRNRPVIVTAITANRSLEDVINFERENGINIPEWNDTKKLIVIYGIASAMSYLHSNSILFRNLIRLNVLLDEYLFPQIFDFRVTKNDQPDKLHSDYNMAPLFMAPETFVDYTTSKATDVYSFGMLVFDMISKENSFEKFTQYQLIHEVVHNKRRPDFDPKFPSGYRNLIEKCWSQDPKERLSFNEIVQMLKEDPNFITNEIDEEQYRSYIQLLDECQNGFPEDVANSISERFLKVHIDFILKEASIVSLLDVSTSHTNLSQFRKSEKIGQGSFGKVYKVIDRKTEIVYAAKTSVLEIKDCNDEIIKNLTREVNILSQLNYVSILKFIGFSQNNFGNKSKPTIITEFAQNGCLDQVIELERMSLAMPNWNDTKKLINIFGIASGMKYLHSLNIIHRDLKPQNIFLDQFLFPKIGDFGLSKQISSKSSNEDGNQKGSGFKGTYAYSSPEVLIRNEYSQKSDVYSFALIVYEIMTCEELYKDFNPFKLMTAVPAGYRPEFKVPVPASYKKLIKKCWLQDEAKRPTFDEIVNLLKTDHGFITKTVNLEEYQDYIETVENNSQFNKELHCSSTVHSTSKIENSSSLMKGFLDLKKFDKQKLIVKDDSYKIYSIQNHKTGKKYTAKESIQLIMFTRTELEEISKEIKIISKLNHKTILKFVGFSPINFKNESNPVTVVDFKPKCTLKDVLTLEKRNFALHEWNEMQKLVCIYGIASGMMYLHSRDILHGNLKPSSIFFDEKLLPKIGDFGFVTKNRNFQSMSFQSTSGMKDLPTYLAPEVIQLNEYTKKADVYSFAMIVYEIVTLEKPFKDLINTNQICSEIVYKSKRPEFIKKVDDCYRKLIESCWSQDPNERPTFDDIVQLIKNDSAFLMSKINKSEFIKCMDMFDRTTEIKSQRSTSQTNEESKDRFRESSDDEEESDD